jgi:hypothetical protein
VIRGDDGHRDGYLGPTTRTRRQDGHVPLGSPSQEPVPPRPQRIAKRQKRPCSTNQAGNPRNQPSRSVALEHAAATANHDSTLHTSRGISALQFVTYGMTPQAALCSMPSCPRRHSRQ